MGATYVCPPLVRSEVTSGKVIILLIFYEANSLVPGEVIVNYFGGRNFTSFHLFSPTKHDKVKKKFLTKIILLQALLYHSLQNKHCLKCRLPFMRDMKMCLRYVVKGVTLNFSYGDILYVKCIIMFV